MIEHMDMKRGAVEKAEDMFSPGSRWVNRQQRDQGLGDAAVWIVEGTTDEGSVVLRNKENPGTRITKAKGELDHISKRTASIEPAPKGMIGGQTVGDWEFGGANDKEPKERQEGQG